MSVNHFSTAVPEIFWRTDPLRSDHVACDPTCFDSNLNRHGDEFEGTLLEDHRHDRDPLFEKPLTPSDVGKLNRLVIPKQHAERCFPLWGLGKADADSGMLLSFEDELGKCWRFRYSYWSSSQSYVLTKGWSRYVKEKKLDPGDVVLFERHRVNSDRLFIGWRRKAVLAAEEPRRVSGVWTGAVAENGYEAGTPYTLVESNHGGNHAGSAVVDRVTTSSSGNSKRFRLFGVNLEYCQQQSEDDDSSDGSQRHYHYPDTYHGNFFNYMDVNQMSN